MSQACQSTIDFQNIMKATTLFDLSSGFLIVFPSDEGNYATMQEVLAELNRHPDKRYVGCIQKEIESEVVAAIDQLTRDKEDFVTFLVQRDNLPRFSGWVQAEVTSFICSVSFFSRLVSSVDGGHPEKWAYRLLEMIYDMEIAPGYIEIQQIPYIARPAADVTGVHFNTVLPHRGLLSDLKVCLHSLMNNRYENLSVDVCLDEKISKEALCDLKASFPTVRFSAVCPAAAGPYVIRQLLIDRLGGQHILYQDSDDIATSDRVRTIASSLSDGCLVGSHELRFDQVNGCIYAVRYPLDVTHALNSKVAFPLLHSTSSLSVVDFQRIGGYSTDRAFANDTQFLYRCFFFVKILNVDEFLYIRKVHNRSLTTDVNHPLEQGVRLSLSTQWKADFEATKDEPQNLDNSSLAVVRKAGFSLLDI